MKKLEYSFIKQSFENNGYKLLSTDYKGTNDKLSYDCINGNRHHINYNKKNCEPWSLITLCNSCNARANFKRSKHKKFYQNIIKNKYNYKEV